MGAGTDLDIDLGQIDVNLDPELVDSDLEIKLALALEFFLNVFWNSLLNVAYQAVT